MCHWIATPCSAICFISCGSFSAADRLLVAIHGTDVYGVRYDSVPSAKHRWDAFMQHNRTSTQFSVFAILRVGCSGL